MVRTGAPRQIKQLRQRRNARAVDRLLLGKALRVLGAGLEPADVVLLHFRERERADRRTLAGEKLAVGSARVFRIEPPVVAHDQHVVFRHREVELERRHADPQRRLETRERVFGREPARAAVALQVEGVRLRGQAGQHCER